MDPVASVVATMVWLGMWLVMCAQLWLVMCAQTAAALSDLVPVPSAPATMVTVVDFDHFWICKHGYRASSRVSYRSIHPHPIECHTYIVCTKGFPRVRSCPLGRYYDKLKRRCVWPSLDAIKACDNGIDGYTRRICSVAETVKVPVPNSCALYLDCSAHALDNRVYSFLMECPYPSLYSAERADCGGFQLVHCGKRPVPVAPCDYIQYHQLCDSPRGCQTCAQRHPSCRRHADGLHPVPRNRRLFKVCVGQRTLDVRACLDYYTYNPTRRKCVPAW